jgi:hypothetical protein
MKIFLNFIISFALTTSICFGQSWKTLDITEFARIDFPALPEISSTPEELVFNITDSSGFYIVSVRDLSSRNLNLTPDQLPEVYRGVIDGALDRSKGQLIEKKDIEIDGNPGVEILYISNSNLQLPELRSKRVFLVKQHLISVDFWTTEDIKQIAEPNKAYFFNSLDFSEKIEQTTKSEVTSSNSEPFQQGYESSYLIGKFVFPVIIILGIVGLTIFIVRKGKRKR